MKPTKEKVRTELKRLRKLIENSECPIERRIAYSMEHAMRWATQSTVSWEKPVVEAVFEANVLKSQMSEPQFCYPAARSVREAVKKQKSQL
jgi:hypothetical protein